ncbi:hypothetical protein [Spirosoma rhododendri]|uniref:Uncharacterized protein n=1 Tax=Spirosoma rhododendri TaxID=2728024 RepID=A0A7L5DWS0_9BACT|nr:hypothetical protein [Spirosoma rhododendri]QJD81098.1 hypothetical protein HH216_23735 [Spirosoma rhododendri]
MPLYNLIDDQTIDFDNHSRGDKKPVVFGDGLHMHKRINAGRHKGVDVIFPVDKPGEYIFKGKNIKEKERNGIISEINRVFKKDKNKVANLTDTVVREIMRYSGNVPQVQSIENIRSGAKNLAEAMGLKPKIIDEIKSMTELKIENFISSHESEDGKQYFVKQDFKRRKIKMSDNIEKLFYANN